MKLKPPHRSSQLDKEDKLYLNLGCGNTAPPGWINCDSSWNAQISKWSFLNKVLKKFRIVSDAEWPANVRYLALSGRLPWANESVDIVYASHVVEHLSQSCAHNFLKESHRVLRYGGILRIVVPDLLYHAKKYVESWSEEKTQAAQFLEATNLRIPEEKNIIRHFYNFVTNYPSIHKQMYDQVTLQDLFLRYRFKNICLSAYGQSEYISNIKEVEYRESGYEGSIYMEGVKI